MRKYDLIVIGSGSGGGTAAKYAARLGAKVALIEKNAEKLGGECLRSGSVPSKALIHAAKADKPTWDLARKNIDRAIGHIRSAQDSPEVYEKCGVDLIFGTAALTRRHGEVKVGRQMYQARRIVLATGSTPYLPNIPGLKKAGYETSGSLFYMAKLPKKLAIIGGGPMAMEMAHVFARLGRQVTVIEHNPHVLMPLDREASLRVEDSLREKGVNIMTSASVIRISVMKQQKVLDVRCAGEKMVLKVDTILVATGRKPCYPAGMDRAGVVTGDSGIPVDDRWRTSAKRIYAVGDVVNLPYKFTHVADMAGAQAALHAVLGVPVKNHLEAQPYVFFTDPEVAQAGATEAQLERDGIEYRVYTMPFSDIDKAVTDEEKGFIKLVVTPRGRVLGGTIVGQCAGELIGYIASAIDKRQSLPALIGLLQPYPTLSLGIKQLAIEANFDIVARFPKALGLMRALRSLR